MTPEARLAPLEENSVERKRRVWREARLRYRAKHADKIKNDKKKYRRNNREKISLSSKVCRMKNLEKIKDKQREYKKTHVRDWSSDQADKRRVYVENAKTRLGANYRKNARAHERDVYAKYKAAREADPCAPDSRKTEWRLNNPARAAEHRRKWELANPDSHRARDHRRRARVAAAGSPFTHEDVVRIKNLQKGRCALCRNKYGRSYHIDHVIALAVGGSNNARNIQILCVSCNLKKGARPQEIMARQMGMLL